MQHELLFLNPIFHSGLNMSVRKGDKWIKVSPGDQLLIKQTGSDDIHLHGVVIGKALIPFKLIKGDDYGNTILSRPT